MSQKAVTSDLGSWESDTEMITAGQRLSVSCYLRS